MVESMHAFPAAAMLGQGLDADEEERALLLQQAEEEMECFATGTFHFSFFPNLMRRLPHACAPAAAAAVTAPAAAAALPTDDHERQQRLKGYIPSSEMGPAASADAASNNGAALDLLLPSPPGSPTAAAMHEREPAPVEPAAAAITAAAAPTPRAVTPLVPLEWLAPSTPTTPRVAATDAPVGPVLSAPASSGAPRSPPRTIGGILSLVRGRASNQEQQRQSESEQPYMVEQLTTTTTTTAAVSPSPVETAPATVTPQRPPRQHRRLMDSTFALPGEIKYVQCFTCSVIADRWVTAPIDAAFVVCAECASVTVARAANTRYPKEELVEQEEGDRAATTTGPAASTGTFCTQRLCARLGAWWFGGSSRVE